MPDYYRQVLIQTYWAHGEQSKHEIRARPLPDQGLPTTMRVQCSAKMRESYPVGTIYKVKAKVIGVERDQHIYTSWQWKYEILSDAEVAAFIAARDWGYEGV